MIAVVALSAYCFGVYLPEKEEQADTERIVREYYENKLSLYEEGNQRYADYTADGAHLTPLGYQIFTDTLTPTLDALLRANK